MRIFNFLSKLFLTFTILLVLLSSQSCSKKSKISVNLHERKDIAISNLAKSQVTSLQVTNNQIFITGNFFDYVSSFSIQAPGGPPVSLNIISKNDTSVVLESPNSLDIGLDTVATLFFSNAYASTAFPITFSLCDTMLGGKAINCSSTPNDSDVLTFDSLSQKWIPKPLSVLSYQGSWDANDPLPSSANIGDFYIVSVANGSYQVGDWVLFNGSSFDRIPTSISVVSVFGRQGAVTAQEGDYSLDNLSDVDISTTPPAINQGLGFNGTKWVPQTFSMTESDPNVENFAKTAPPTCAAGEFIKSNGTSLSCSAVSSSESDPSVMLFAKSTLPACGAGQFLKGDGLVMSCVTATYTETDPNVSAFAKASPPTCAAGEFIKSDGSTLTCASPSVSESDPNVSSFAKAALPSCSGGQFLVGDGTSLSCSSFATGLSASSVVTTNASGALATSSVTSTELSYLSGVSSAIQTQLNGKASLSGATFTSSVTATAFFYSSDARLKKDIKTLSNPVNRILNLRGVDFKWKKDDKKEIGFIAQEVEKSEPLLVETYKTDKGLERKAVKYGNITAILVEAFKDFYKKFTLNQNETNRKIASLEKKNQELESKLRDQESRLIKLEAQLKNGPKK